MDLDVREQQQPEPVGGARVAENVVFPDEVKAKYEIGALLGAGPFSVVRRGKSKADGIEVALKLQDAQIAPGVDFSTAQRVLEKLKGKPSLSNLVEIIPYSKGVCTVVSLHGGSELLKELAKGSKPWAEADAVSVIRRLLTAVQALRESLVLHLNITTENILFEESSGSLVLEGFTLSRSVANVDEVIKTPIAGGTLHFQAPEVIFHSGYSIAADMWSVGVVSYILLTGNVPWTEKHPVKLKVAIKKGIAEYPSTLSKEAIAFLQSLLSVDPAKRATPEQALASDLLKSGGSQATVITDFRKNILTQIK